MESNKAEKLIEKYLNGESTSADEVYLKNYFSSSNVAAHLKQYQPLFAFDAEVKGTQSMSTISKLKKKPNIAWAAIAASLAIFLGVSLYFLNKNSSEKQELGTYNSPEVALKETQKALSMLSSHVNVGIESVLYVNEYEKSKNLIFKQY
jgi:hypothetical protein